nr:MAG TPA: hypothetical protein [Caudoviricetes sp.]
MEDNNDADIAVILLFVVAVTCIGLVISRQEQNKKALEVEKKLRLKSVREFSVKIMYIKYQKLYTKHLIV